MRSKLIILLITFFLCGGRDGTNQYPPDPPNYRWDGVLPDTSDAHYDGLRRLTLYAGIETNAASWTAGRAEFIANGQACMLELHRILTDNAVDRIADLRALNDNLIILGYMRFEHAGNYHTGGRLDEALEKDVRWQYRAKNTDGERAPMYLTASNDTLFWTNTIIKDGSQWKTNWDYINADMDTLMAFINRKYSGTEDKFGYELFDGLWLDFWDPRPSHAGTPNNIDYDQDSVAEVASGAWSDGAANAARIKAANDWILEMRKRLGNSFIIIWNTSDEGLHPSMRQYVNGVSMEHFGIDGLTANWYYNAKAGVDTLSNTILGEQYAKNRGVMWTTIEEREDANETGNTAQDYAQCAALIFQQWWGDKSESNDETDFTDISFRAGRVLGPIIEETSGANTILKRQYENGIASITYPTAGAKDSDFVAADFDSSNPGEGSVVIIEEGSIYASPAQ